MKKRERNLFFAIASYGMDKGFDVSLEKKNAVYSSSALNGVIAQSDNSDDGLILRVYRTEEPDKED